MKLFLQGLVSVTLTGLAILLVVLFFTVDFTEPGLEKVELSPQERSTYYRKLRSVLKRSGGSFELSLTHREATHFFQQYVTGREFEWFELTAFRLRRSGDLAGIDVVLRGPVGLYYRLSGRGRLVLDRSGSKLELDELYLGPLPLAWAQSYFDFASYLEPPSGANYSLRELRVGSRGLYLQATTEIPMLDWLE